MNLDPHDPIGRLVRARSEHGMREPEAIPIELDDSRFERGAKACLTIDSRRRLRDGHRGMRMRGRGEQEVTACLGQCQQPFVDEVVERLGDGQGLPGLDRDVAALQGSNDLERVERVAA